MFWYLQTFLTMLKLMFIYNQFMILDDKSFRKCVFVFAATLTRSKHNWGFVYLCIRSKDFVPISMISDYIHWAALAVWFCVFHYIDEIRNVRKLVTFLFCFIQYINTTTHSIKDLNLFGMYLCIDFIADICITIQSHQSNQTVQQLDEPWSVVSIPLILFLSVTCNTCICIIYLG